MKKAATAAPVAQVSFTEVSADPRFDPDHAENIALAGHARSIEATVKRALARLGTNDAVANRLDAILSPGGHNVSPATLRSAFAENAAETRNYSRLAWLVLVLHDPEVQAVLAPRTYTAEERWQIAQEYLAAEAPGLLRGLMAKLGRPS